MAEVIDIKAARERRDGPHPAFVSTDDEGETVYLFWADYHHAGQTLTLEIWARDFEAAEQHVQALRDSLTVLGQVMDEIDADDEVAF